MLGNSELIIVPGGKDHWLYENPRAGLHFPASPAVQHGHVTGFWPMGCGSQWCAPLPGLAQKPPVQVPPCSAPFPTGIEVTCRVNLEAMCWRYMINCLPEWPCGIIHSLPRTVMWTWSKLLLCVYILFLDLLVIVVGVTLNDIGHHPWSLYCHKPNTCVLNLAVSTVENSVGRVGGLCKALNGRKAHRLHLSGLIPACVFFVWLVPWGLYRHGEECSDCDLFPWLLYQHSFFCCKVSDQQGLPSLCLYVTLLLLKSCPL